MLREIFGTEREEEAGTWRKFHVENEFSLYRQLYIVKVAK
jgi:hypothetical protein